MKPGVITADRETLREVIAEELARALAPLRETISDDSRSQGVSDKNALLTSQDVAELLRIDRRTLRRMAQAGELPAPITLGERTLRWRRSSIEKFLSKKDQRA